MGWGCWQGNRDTTRGPGMPKTIEQSNVKSRSCSAVGWGDEEGHEDTALQKSTPLDIGHGPTEGVEPAQPVQWYPHLSYFKSPSSHFKGIFKGILIAS